MKSAKVKCCRRWTLKVKAVGKDLKVFLVLKQKIIGHWREQGDASSSTGLSGELYQTHVCVRIFKGYLRDVSIQTPNTR